MQNTERNDLLEWEGPPDEYDRISAEEFITGKKPLKAIALLIVAASALFGQAVRIDPQPTTTTAGNQPPGTYQPILAVPGSTIKICANSSCSVAASTYTDQTATALCDTAHPLVPRGTSGCASTADAQGNFGFWVVPGSYWYTIQFPNGNQFGPYPTSNGAAGKEGKAFPVICSAGACSQTILNLGLAGHNQGQNVGVWCFSGPLTADWKVTGNVVSCGANNDGLGDITFTWTGNTVQSLLVMGNGPGPMGPPGQGAINLVSVATYGVSGQCGDAGALQTALNSTAGKFWLYFPAAIQVQMCSGYVTVPSGSRITGDGPTLSKINCAGIQGPGYGCFDITASDVIIEKVGIDSGGTSTTGLLYSTAVSLGANAPLFTLGSPIWVKGGSHDITIRDVDLTHPVGYAPYFDSTNGSISNIKMQRVRVMNSRQFLFGTTSGQLNYGSWTGGTFFYSPGAAFNFSNVSVDGGTYQNVVGNALWTHVGANTLLSTQLTWTNNQFIDTGLDDMQIAGWDGFTIATNHGQRGGYVVTSDVGQTRIGGPMWHQVASPVAIDHAGIAINGIEDGNRFNSQNGEIIDCDGCGTTNVIGNVGESCFISVDPMADAAHCGPSTAIGQNYVRGLTWNNSANSPQVGQFNSIVGNQFYGMGGGGIQAFAFRNGTIQGNLITMPNVSFYNPIVLGNTGSLYYQRSTSNAVTGNIANWNAPSGSPMIFEDGVTYTSPFLSTEYNWVRGNYPFGTNLLEFSKSQPDNSSTGPVVGSSVTAGATPYTEFRCQAEGQGTSQSDFAFKCYSNVLGVGTQLFQFDNATGLTLPASRAFVMGTSPVVDAALNGYFHSASVNGVGVVIDSSGGVHGAAGTTIIYRCMTSGALPAGALTSVSGSCGTTVDSGIRTQ